MTDQKIKTFVEEISLAHHLDQKLFLGVVCKEFPLHEAEEYEELKAELKQAEDQLGELKDEVKSLEFDLICSNNTVVKLESDKRSLKSYFEKILGDNF